MAEWIVMDLCLLISHSKKRISWLYNSTQDNQDTVLANFTALVSANNLSVITASWPYDSLQ